MTEPDVPTREEVVSDATPLELFTDDERVWTAVPADASGEDRVSKWIEVEADALCDLGEWC
ncbi:DUF7511 domain-containing protein [Natrinema caseinilyticum]|uniref:DUF7511 domain-containing protein n=1 Tax=Natrinema caseinilyticum TaxID=2961570 RepID=UPI0020C3A193|nr:hypothetical protein [Natrinema caseinilyticum]